MWESNHTLSSNRQVRKEITKKIRTCLEMHKNEDVASLCGAQGCGGKGGIF